MEQQIVSKEVFGKRFSELISSSRETTYSIAEKLSLTPASISRYSNGLMAPKIPTVYMIAAIFRVNPVWLMGYDAPKYEEGDKLSDAALEIAKDYDALDAHGKKMVRMVTDEEKERINSSQDPKLKRFVVKKNQSDRGSMSESEFERYMATPFAARNGGLQGSNPTRARHLKVLEEDIGKK